MIARRTTARARRPRPTPPRAAVYNRLVHETPAVCWPVLGGCGTRLGLTFAGGACPHCGAFAVAPIKLVDPDPVSEGAA